MNALAPVLHVKLGRVALCLETDCEAVFELAGICPSCGSRTFVNLSRLVNRAPVRFASDGDVRAER